MNTTYPTTPTQSAYAVTATREHRWWVLDVEGIGATQCRRLTEATDTVRELVGVMTNTDASEAVVSITVGGAEGKRVEDVQRALKEAAEAQAAAAAVARRAVAHLVNEAHLSQSDVAVALGVSKQRVSQLAHAS